MCVLAFLLPCWLPALLSPYFKLGIVEIVVSLDMVDLADECLDLTDSAGILALLFVPEPASCWDTLLKFLDLLDAPVYCDTDAFDTCAVAVSGALGLYACFDGLDGLDGLDPPHKQRL